MADTQVIVRLQAEETVPWSPARSGIMPDPGGVIPAAGMADEPSGADI
jgi:hypothetical protein